MGSLAFKNRRTLIAIVAALAQRATSFLFQILLASVCVRTFGPRGYGEYAYLTAVAAGPTIFMIRFGPTLVSSFAGFIHFNEIEKQQYAVRFCFAASAAWATVLFSIFLTALLFVDVTSLAAVPNGKMIVLLLSFASLYGIVLTTTDLLQSAFLESYKSSIRALIATIISSLLLVLALPRYPSLLNLCLIVAVVPLIAQMANLAVFYLQRRDIFRQSFAATAELRSTLARGTLAFTAIGGLSSYLCHQFPLLTAAWVGTGEQVSRLAVLFTMVLGLFSVASIIITPLCAVFSYAKHEKNRHLSLVYLLGGCASLIVFGACVIPAIYLYGEGVFRNVVSDAISPSPIQFALASAYMIAVSLENFLYSVSLTIGMIRMASLMLFIRAVGTAIFAVVSSSKDYESNFFAFACILTLLVTVLPLLIINCMKVIRQ